MNALLVIGLVFAGAALFGAISGTDTVLGNIFVIIWWIIQKGLPILVIILIIMILYHIIDDYCLQSLSLCDLKQKSYWKENAPDKMYEKDYLCALVMHASSWGILTMLPIAIYVLLMGQTLTSLFYLFLILNIAAHAYIDNMKANKRIINLWGDQTAHIYQILLTFLAFTGGLFGC